VLFLRKTEKGIHKSLSHYQAVRWTNCKVFATKILPDRVEIFFVKLCITLQERGQLIFAKGFLYAAN
jgi:hypothetical protein